MRRSFVLFALPALTACASAVAHPPAEHGHEMHDETVVAPMSADGGAHEVPEAPSPERTVRSELREWFGAGKRAPDPFDGYARPVTNLHFHHPFIWNEVRPVVAFHRFPETSAVGGGDLRVYALQLHAALSDSIQFTAYKDGYVDFNPDGLPDEEGWADIAFGLKAMMWKDVEAKRAFTAGLGYETTVGASDVLEGQGHGMFDLFGSYATPVGPVNLIVTAGMLLPRDSGSDARSTHWHVHADMPVMDKLSALVEVNGMHVVDDAHRNARLGAPLGFEGFDYTNLGASGTEGNDVSLGAAYEWSVTDREDLFQDRVTIDLVFRF